MSEIQEMGEDHSGSKKKGLDSLAIASLVLLFILVAFGVFVLLDKPETAVSDNYKYSNGESIFEVNVINDIETYIGLTIDEVNGERAYTIALRNDPLSLEDIPAEGTFHTRVYDDEEIFVTIHPGAGLTGKTTIAALEIDKIIDNDALYGVPVHSAFTVPLEGDTETPIRKCSDGTADSTVIWLTLASQTKVYTEGNCIIIAGTDEDELIRAADRFLLTLLGIMQ
jgi:hypothetical protein